MIGHTEGGAGLIDESEYLVVAISKEDESFPYGLDPIPLWTDTFISYSHMQSKGWNVL